MPKGKDYKIIQAQTAEDFNAIKGLFTAYSSFLNLDLSFQDYTTEFTILPGKYAPPYGELLLALSSEESSIFSTSPTTSLPTPLGCVALRPLSLPSEDRVCEMKRLWTSPQARGKGIGKALVREIIKTAKEIGYIEMRLDSLPSIMGSAVGLYESEGFEKMEEPYYETPLKETVFFRLDLRKWKNGDEGGGGMRPDHPERLSALPYYTPNTYL